MMRRIASILAGIVIVACGSAFIVSRMRPDLVPAWARPRPAPEAEASPGLESLGSTLEADAPDDGWCAHRGKPGQSGCVPSLPTIRLASDEVAAQIGLATTRSIVQRVAPHVVGNAEISYASHEYAHVTSRVPGRVAEVPKDEGEEVKKGDVLVVVDSAEVGSIKANYLSLLPIAGLARENYERSANLRQSGAAADKEVLTAKAELNRTQADVLNARQKLLNLGYTDSDITQIESTRDTSNFLKILAPMSGTLVERHAITGEAVMPPSGGLATGPSASLFDITDLDHLWCWIDVNEMDVIRVKKGQSVTFTISATEAPVFSGHVDLIGFAVNPSTRTVRVRAEVENIDGRLRANQFGRAVIQVGEERDAVAVPRSALQGNLGEEFLFLPLGGGRFRTQRVATQAVEDPGFVEITWGLKAGQEVVTTGSFELKSELLRATLVGE